jgi:hypothetical protein
MIATEDLSALAPALIAAQAKFEAVAKTSDNPFFKSKYAGLPAVVKAASPILAENGLAVVQTIGNDTLTTVLLHASGQFIMDTATLHLPKADPQGQGSAVTYARRYGYMAILGLVADEDDDGNAASKPATHTTERPSPVLDAKAPSEPTAVSHSPAAAGPGRVYLDVPYEDKDEAKGFGARWDAKAVIPGKKKPGSWYIPKDADPFPLMRWIVEPEDAEEQGFVDAEHPF